MRGRFITFEGGEGVGKSTQIERLGKRLESCGVPVVTTREPGGSEKAEDIRKAVLSGAGKRLGPLAEALLFSAARADHLEQTIRPALRRGAFVLCDRFADSTRAYQGLNGAVDARTIEGLERIVVAETRPDLTVILDLPPQVGLERARHRRQGRAEGADRFEAEDLDFHELLRQAFIDIALAEPRRCIVIDASGEADAIEELVWKAVERRFGDDIAAASAGASAARPSAGPSSASLAPSASHGG
jgi:dTMP kinase